ncbi:MAG TPA: hypothetical protein VEK10_06370 [Steroidobacteraceae bacterium]|nr:hypothetical protein [Steroidobacteraceae bacterium]
MNSFIAMAYRDLTCAAAALLITLIVGASFVESTSAAPGVGASTTVSAGYARA